MTGQGRNGMHCSASAIPAVGSLGALQRFAARRFGTPANFLGLPDLSARTPNQRELGSRIAPGRHAANGEPLPG